VELALNISFGVVGVVSFFYAIWQNQALRRAEQLAARVTHNIQQLAREIIAESPGTPAMAYARSIVQVSGSLIDGRRTSTRSADVGVFEIEYIALQLRSRMARPEECTDAKYLTAISGKFSGQPWTVDDFDSTAQCDRIQRESALVYGPYKNLPIAGVYEVEFRLRRGEVNRMSSHGLVLLDVYQLSKKSQLARLQLSSRDVIHSWQSVKLTFDYVDPSALLEYRVLVMQANITIALDLVIVRLISRF